LLSPEKGERSEKNLVSLFGGTLSGRNIPRLVSGFCRGFVPVHRLRNVPANREQTEASYFESFNSSDLLLLLSWASECQPTGGYDVAVKGCDGHRAPMQRWRSSDGK
jgi:hypothetical protein